MHSEDAFFPKTLYICNRQKMCGKSIGCYYEGRGGECYHTTSRVNAKYGVCDDPWNHPERFSKLKFNSTTDCYVEKGRKKNNG